MNGALCHALILAWGIRSKSFTTEVTESTEFGPEGTCPFVQCGQRNTPGLAEIFRRAIPYYLVQEKL
jgi:hypothetical protein